MSVKPSDLVGKHRESPLKWVGGKERVKDLILSNFPANFDRYCELFLGSGVIFLLFRQRFPNIPCFISDINPHLICWWQALRDNKEVLIDELKQIKDFYENGDNKENYYKIRADFNSYDSLDVRKAALFMFLCKTSFNSLVRYSKKGKFNAAWGHQTKVKRKEFFIFDIEQLFRVKNCFLQI